MQNRNITRGLLILLAILFLAIVNHLFKVKLEEPPSEADYLNELYTISDYETIVNEANTERLFEEQDYDSLSIVAESYYLTHDYRASMALLERLLPLNDTVSTRNLLYRTYNHFDMDEEVQELIAESIEIYCPKYDSLYNYEKIMICAWLIINEDFEEAINMYKLLLKDPITNDMRSNIYNNLAWAYIKVGDYDNGVQFSKKSLEFEIDNITLCNLGNAYYALGKYEKALETFEKSYNIDNKYTPTLSGYASSLEALGKYEEAIRFLEEYLTIKQSNIDAWKRLYNLICEDDDQKSMDILKRIVEMDPTSSYYMSALLVLLDNSGRQAELSEYLTFYKNNNDDSSYTQMYGDYLIQVNPKAGVDIYKNYILSTASDIWSTYSIYDAVYRTMDTDILESFEAFLDETYGYEERLVLEFAYFIDNYENEKIVEIGKELLMTDDANMYITEKVGLAYWELGDYENTVTYLEKSIAVETPTNYELNCYIDALITMDHLNEAKTYIQNAMQDAESNSTLYLQQARIRIREGNIKLAKSNLKSYLAANDDAQYVIYTYDEFSDISYEELLKE